MNAERITLIVALVALLGHVVNVITLIYHCRQDRRKFDSLERL